MRLAIAYPDDFPLAGLERAGFEARLRAAFGGGHFWAHEARECLEMLAQDVRADCEGAAWRCTPQAKRFEQELGVFEAARLDAMHETARSQLVERLGAHLGVGLALQAPYARVSNLRRDATKGLVARLTAVGRMGASAGVFVGALALALLGEPAQKVADASLPIQVAAQPGGLPGATIARVHAGASILDLAAWLHAQADLAQLLQVWPGPARVLAGGVEHARSPASGRNRL